MNSLEQRFRANQETLAYLRSKENIQASIQENPQFWKELAIEEEVLKGLLARRSREVKATLDRGYNIFAITLFALLTILALGLFNTNSFVQFSFEKQMMDVAMQFGLIAFSIVAFVKCLTHFRSYSY